jgi:hypothetical protein
MASSWAINRSPRERSPNSQFIALDRRCCPCIRHGLFVEPDTGSTWLHLSGGDGVKQVIASDVLGMVPDEVARAGELTN